MKLRQKLLLLLLILATALSLVTACAPKSIIDLDSIPEYSGVPYVEINGGVPYFEDDEITSVAFEEYSYLDAMGRCGVAFACIGTEIMPTEEREDISSVLPSGWEYNDVSNNRAYDFVENEYVYNRCHLIGFQLAGENANEKNLITGTRYMNVEGMLPFENRVADYIEQSGNHVLYRVTPIFDNYDLVARGVLMEAYSVEDSGLGVCFCVYVYNVQPGVTIDYFTGRNVPSGEELPSPDTDEEEIPTEGDGDTLYVLNTKTKKFHYPDRSCSSTISDKNRAEFTGSREELIEDGYSPCGTCKP